MRAARPRRGRAARGDHVVIFGGTAALIAGPPVFVWLSCTLGALPVGAAGLLATGLGTLGVALLPSLARPLRAVASRRGDRTARRRAGPP